MTNEEKMIWAAAYALSMRDSHKPKIGVGERERYAELDNAVAQAIHDAADAVFKLRQDLRGLAKGGRDSWRLSREQNVDLAAQMVGEEWRPTP